MIEKFRLMPDPSKQPSIATIEGIKREVYTSFFRYFAPVAAIIEEAEKTARMPVAWQRKKLEQDRHAD
jgi:hypothetical protein